jgi:hypothetical protein
MRGGLVDCCEIGVLIPDGRAPHAAEADCADAGQSRLDRQAGSHGRGDPRWTDGDACA